MTKSRSLKEEQVEDMSHLLNKVIIKETIRENGSLRIQQDFSNCPSMAEQDTMGLTRVQTLVDKYTPDELAVYLAQKESMRQALPDHDYSQDLPLDQAKNVVYVSQKAWNALPLEIKMQFPSYVEFLKHIDNPQNAETLVKLGILKKEQIGELQNFGVANSEQKATTTTEEEKVAKATTATPTQKA